MGNFVSFVQLYQNNGRVFLLGKKYDTFTCAYGTVVYRDNGCNLYGISQYLVEASISSSVVRIYLQK